MPDYRRAWHPGETYFFTVNLLQRQGNDLLARRIELLRAVVKSMGYTTLLRFMAGWYYPDTCIASSNCRRVMPTMQCAGD